MKVPVVALAAISVLALSSPAFARHHHHHKHHKSMMKSGGAMKAPMSSGSTSTQTTPGPTNPKPTQ